jgi:hypothetical protein
MKIAFLPSIVASVFITSIVAGCGGDSSGSGPSSAEVAQVTQDCKDLCNKEVSCMPGLGLDCNQVCSGIGSNPSQGMGSTASSCNVDAVHQKTEQCVSGSCADLQTCADSIDQICPTHGSGQTGSGGSGSTSTGGSGGSSSGSGACSVCTKAQACCQAIVTQEGGSMDSCNGISEATCNGVPAADQGSYIGACQAQLSGGQALNIAVCM